jgi:predicted HD phosphohydrolase
MEGRAMGANGRHQDGDGALPRPLRTADEAWAALEAQQGMSDGEAVDLWTHQVQTAAALVRAGEDDEMVVAGLLHDLGDGRVSEAAHAAWGAALVRGLLGERVAWLIETHAEAKRYVCTVQPEYRARLSPVSRRTLQLQGGPMTAEEVRRFEAHPWFADALRLRLCDDGGKDPAVRVDDVAPLRAALDRVAAARRN